MTSKETEKKNDSQPLRGRTVPIATENEIFVYAVSTNEEAEAVPVADSTALPPKQSFDEQPRHSPQTYTIQDSGFDCLLCGDVKVRHLKPGSKVSLSLCGDIDINMRDVDYPAGSTFKLFVLRACGDIRMIVPRGTQVNCRRLLLCGSRNIHVRDQTSYDAAPPTITINALMLCGDIKICSEEVDM